MKIGAPKIIREHHRVFYRVDVESIRGRTVLWYSLPEAFGGLVSKLCDAPLAALLIPAMADSEDIHIDGMISDRLVFNSHRLQKLLQHTIPSLRRIHLHPLAVDGRQIARAAGVATGFSGGIDSWCLLADHYYADVPARFKVTHLLFNNVGSHGIGGEQLFAKRFQRMSPVAERLGLPYVDINSNLDQFYGSGLNFLQTHTLRNASVALLLQGGIGCFLYASAYSYPDLFVGPTDAMGYSDSMMMSLLSTSTLDAISVGSEYTRVEKTLRAAELPDSHNALDVCVNAKYTGGHINCSTCWKCLRTLSTLDIAGLLERYSPSFDLQAYRSLKKEYWASIPASDDPLMREIAQFARQRGVPLTG